MLAGNGEPAIRVLRLLLEVWPPSEIAVIAPGPGQRHGWQPCLATEARRLGIAPIEAANVNDPSLIAAVLGAQRRFLFSVFYTQLFGADFLAAVDGVAINFHPSLLPRHRGTAPLIWAIAEGDSRTGVTAHLIDEGVDTGPVVLQHEIPIHPLDTGYTLYRKCSLLTATMAAELIRTLASGRDLPAAHPQTGVASLHRKREAKLHKIRWKESRQRICDVVRALAPPLPGAEIEIAGRVLSITGAEPCDLEQAASPPGTVAVVAGAIYVWAGDGPLRIRVSSGGDAESAIRWLTDHATKSLVLA